MYLRVSKLLLLTCERNESLFANLAVLFSSAQFGIVEVPSSKRYFLTNQLTAQPNEKLRCLADAWTAEVLGCSLAATIKKHRDMYRRSLNGISCHSDWSGRPEEVLR